MQKRWLIIIMLGLVLLGGAWFIGSGWRKGAAETGVASGNGRIEAVDVDGVAAASYSYDANGNRTAGPGVEAAAYDAQDRLLSYGDNSYTYSANGDLATKTTPAGTTSYSYDEMGNLVAAVLPDGTEVEYVIDGLNRRVGRMVNGTLARGWLYDGDLAIVAELHDWRRFDSPRAVMAYLALVPSESSSGGQEWRGPSRRPATSACAACSWRRPGTTATGRG